VNHPKTTAAEAAAIRALPREVAASFLRTLEDIRTLPETRERG
jgi:membrane protein YdbS with pleckstrin-like domain